MKNYRRWISVFIEIVLFIISVLTRFPLSFYADACMDNRSYLNPFGWVWLSNRICAFVFTRGPMRQHWFLVDVTFLFFGWVIFSSWKKKDKLLLNISLVIGLIFVVAFVISRFLRLNFMA
jgi:hypothetical protein